MIFALYLEAYSGPNIFQWALKIAFIAYIYIIFPSISWQKHLVRGLNLKQLHAVFLFTTEQRHWRHNVTFV